MRFLVLLLLPFVLSSTTFAATETQLASPIYIDDPESATMITKGFRIGLGVAPSLSVKNELNGFSADSGTLTGMEMGFVRVPRPWVNGNHWMNNIGFMVRMEVYSDKLNKSPEIGDKEFTVSAFNASVTYSHKDNLYAYLGLNLPNFSFENQYNDGLKELDFEGKTGLLIGVGYEIINDLTLDFTMAQQKYDLNVRSTWTSALKTRFGVFEHNFSRLALNYTF